MSMEKRGVIGPDTPDLDADKVLGQKRANALPEKPPKKTPDELDSQDPAKRQAEGVKDRLKSVK
jgi:hypothetical protein